VRKFVDDFHATDKKLSVLVNNAGLALNFKDTKRQYTKDNFEMLMGTNHIGTYLQTPLVSSPWFSSIKIPRQSEMVA